MISALARGGRILADPELTAAAAGAARFIWEHLRDADGGLLKRWRRGNAGLNAHLDDHAFYLRGLIDLYEAGYDPIWLERANDIADRMVERFHDAEGGGFFFAASGAGDLIARRKEIYDGATPSGNSAAALALLRLGRLTARPDRERIAAGIIRSFSREVGRAPAGYTYLLSALDYLLGPTAEVVVAGRADAGDTRQFLEALAGRYEPNLVTLFRPTGEPEPAIVEVAAYTRSMTDLEEKAAAYVCREYSCSRPVSSVEEMLALIDEQTGGSSRFGDEVTQR
jgi:uncharacterized protein YyaL (SSP411 family)